MFSIPGLFMLERSVYMDEIYASLIDFGKSIVNKTKRLPD
jgi:hypothetical protein